MPGVLPGSPLSSRENGGSPSQPHVPPASRRPGPAASSQLRSLCARPGRSQVIRSTLGTLTSGRCDDSSSDCPLITVTVTQRQEFCKLTPNHLPRAPTPDAIRRASLKERRLGRGKPDGDVPETPSRPQRQRAGFRFSRESPLCPDVRGHTSHALWSSRSVSTIPLGRRLFGARKVESLLPPSPGDWQLEKPVCG